MPRLLRYLWPMPTTLLGLVLAIAALRGGRMALVDGVLEAHGPILRWCLANLIPAAGGIAAITLGHVVLGQTAQALRWTRGHERVHVRQYERWGPFFVVAYLGASAWAVARGRHHYFDNHFEREAFGVEASHP